MHELRRQLQSFGSLLSNQRKVENISACNTISAMPEFFGQNLFGCLNPNLAAHNDFLAETWRSQVRRSNKINLSLGEEQLDVTCRFHIVICNSVRNITQAWRYETQRLRIRHKDIDVFAKAVAETKHQRRAPAECPERVRTAMLSDFVD